MKGGHKQAVDTGLIIDELLADIESMASGLRRLKESLKVSDLASHDEAAEIIGCTKRTISNYIAQGKIHYITRGRMRGLNRKEIQLLARR